MNTITKRLYDEMGDGYEEAIIYQRDMNDSSTRGVIHVGMFYDDMPSSVNARFLDSRGMRKKD